MESAPHPPSHSFSTHHMWKICTTYPQPVDNYVDIFSEPTFLLLFSLKKQQFCYTIEIILAYSAIHNSGKDIHKTEIGHTKSP